MGLLIAAAAITLALVGSLNHTSSHDAQFDAGSPVVAPQTRTTPAHGRPTTPSALRLSGSRPPVSPDEVHLQAALTKALRKAGPMTGALVYDLTARSELYALRATVRRPPASVEKLWTTVGILLKLGPNTRLRTSILGTGSLRNGVWHGNLYLRGGGDPTFGDPTFNRVWTLGTGPTAAQLAAQLAARGIHRVTGRLYPDESLFDRRRGGLLTDYGVDTPDFGGQLSALVYDHGSITAHYSPSAFAAREVGYALQSAGIRVKAARHDAVTPGRARLLGSVSSPPVSMMTRLMDVPSDDLYAELLTKQLGVLFGGGGSISAGAKVIADAIAATYGLHPRILDGSGLSRDDASSPLQVVGLLSAIWGTSVGRQLAASLPTVGREGTVQGIGLKTPAAGNCIAKTGTLNYVTNLAGYCRARDRHMLAFTLMIDGPDNGSATALESRMVGAIAGY